MCEILLKVYPQINQSAKFTSHLSTQGTAHVSVLEPICLKSQTTPVLVHPNPDLLFIAEVNTSSTWVGVVLSQWQGDPSQLHPCTFYFKKLSLVEQKHNIEKHELLAIKLSLVEWRHWLEGANCHFEVITNHRNFEYLCYAKRLHQILFYCLISTWK